MSSEADRNNWLKVFWKRKMKISTTELFDDSARDVSLEDAREDFKSVSLKSSDIARAEEMAEEMRVASSHVIGMAVRRTFSQCGRKVMSSEEGSGVQFLPGAIEDKILEFNADMLKKESSSTTGIFLSKHVTDLVDEYCSALGITKTAFIGFAIKDLWDYRKKPKKKEDK